MNLTVNGIAHEVEGSELVPLLDVLRNELGVTGPKAGCLQGGCDRARCSSTASRGARASSRRLRGRDADHDGRGHGAAQDLSPIQQAFVHYYAAQCGFCTSGCCSRHRRT